MKFLSTFLAILGVLHHQTPVGAVEWHTMYSNMPDGAQVIAFSGNMTIPPHISPSMTYLWPGLQSNDGVFQTVLDGRSDGWWVGSGWYGGGPSYPWGGGFDVSVGESINFNYTSNSTGWTINLTGPNGGNATNLFEGLRKLSK
jgi:hypothetical protein